MKKIINNKKNIVRQMVDGIIRTYPKELNNDIAWNIISKNNLEDTKVTLISGGGSGHEPAHIGFIGKGLLDVVVCGEVFTPPLSKDILKAIEETYNNNGTLLIIKNYERDIREFLEAEELAISKGLKVSHIIVNDDCSVDIESMRKRRRGVAGTIYVHKIIGAASEEGLNLQQLVELGNDVILSSNTLGFALNPNTIPGEFVKQFELNSDEISFGIGIHGEPGYRVEKLTSSEELANELVNKLKSVFRWKPEEQFAILINGLGGTPLLELFIFANDVYSLLELECVDVVYSQVAEYMTSNNMEGLSVTLLRLKDSKWLTWLNKPAYSFAWKNI